jgi:Ras family protein A
VGSRPSWRKYILVVAPVAPLREPLLRTTVVDITYYSRISKGSTGHDNKGSITLLRDNDQPFIFDIRLFNRPYRFQFHDTATPNTWTLLNPTVILLCYDISNRHSLLQLQRHWSKLIPKTFDNDGNIPVMMLGLKRDLRSETDPNGIIYPQEGYRIAQELRCDAYLECSAVTGELVHEVFEDICRTAAKASISGDGTGGLSSGGCGIM